MRTAGGLLRKIIRLEALIGNRFRQAHPILGELRTNADALMVQAGLPPDPWQHEVLHSTADRMLMLCSRQTGKSTVAAALALQAALLRPRSPVLLLSPSMRQSSELFRKVLDLFKAVGQPIAVVAESALRLELANGSRIITLPGTEGTVRGYSGVSLLVIDESARVSDSLYYAVRPMLAVSHGRLVALSTPFGKRGWFHFEWEGKGDWQRVKITAEHCPRIAREFLDQERQALGDRWYNQEYLCEFTDVIDAVFSYSDIQAAMSDEVKPLFGN